jgi:[ribosomal protein S18]-alanine N-acetyltransferase
VSLTLRAPFPADYEELASWVPDAQACIRWAGPRVSFPLASATLSGLLEVAGACSYVLAEGAAGPVGFGQHWVLAPGAVHLGRIIVSPLARGRGLGRALCEPLIARALQFTGAGSVTLRVYRDNLAALRLYTGLGFVPVEAESTEAVLFMRFGPALR